MSSATQPFDGGAEPARSRHGATEPAPGQDDSAVLALHAASSEDEVAHALGQALGSHAPARWTIAFREPGEVGEAIVFTSTVATVTAGTRLTLSDAVAVGPEPVYQRFALRVHDGDPSPLDSHLSLPLIFANNHYGYLLLHDAVGDSRVPDLRRLAEHLGVAFYKRQAERERHRLHDLDARKLTMMMQATNVVLRELDLERSLAKLIELTVSSVGGEVGCIFLARSDERLPGLRHASWGIEEDALREMCLAQDGRSLIDVVAVDGMTCLFRDREELRELRPTEALDAISTLIALPVEAARGVRACLLVANAPGLGQVELELLRLATEVCSTAIDNALRHQLSLERESLQEQLRLAGDIQQSLLPEAAPDMHGVDLHGCNVPCDESSGDYYDFLALDDHRVAFVVADATGHGIGAALMATTARAALRALLYRRHGEFDLADVLLELNALAESDMADDKFITLFIGVYDTRTRALTYASAGHDPPLLLLRQGAGELEHLGATGLPLGMFAHSTYESVCTGALDVGDYLLLATDGLNEARNGSGEQFGMERIENMLRNAGGIDAIGVVSALIDEQQAFTELRPREDDITMICMRVAD